MSSKITDMTVGSPSKHILLFALPLFIGNIFQQFYNMVDSIIVGNFVGANALAAVGTCGSTSFLFFSLSSGLAIGIGIIVAQFFGAKDEQNVRATIANSIYVLGAVSILVSLLGFIFAPALLTLLSCPETVFADAVLYLRTSCCGIIFIAFYNGVASILRALGDSRTPLYFLILSSIINLLLDLLFVIQFHLGVFGVAIATIISQAVSAVTSLIYSIKTIPYFHLSKKELKPNSTIIIRSFKLGVPMALQNSLIAISCMVLQSVVNSFGETVMAAYTIEMKIEQLIQQPFGSIGMALTNYAGQNMGARNFARVKKGFWRGTLFITVIILIVIPVAFIFGEGIVSLFVKDEEVIHIGGTALKIVCLFLFGLGMIYVPRGCLNGCGDTTFSMINGVTEVICRIIFSEIFTKISFLHLFGHTFPVGYWGIWLTSGFTWTITGIVCCIRFKKGRYEKQYLKEK